MKTHINRSPRDFLGRSLFRFFEDLPYDIIIFEDDVQIFFDPRRSFIKQDRRAGGMGTPPP